MKTKQFLRLYVGGQTIAFLHLTTDDVIEIKYSGIVKQYEVLFIHNSLSSTLWCDKYEWCDK